eukprot:Nk52_evm4s598 gene=Nk52_evmTU4s598
MGRKSKPRDLDELLYGAPSSSSKKLKKDSNKLKRPKAKVEKWAKWAEENTMKKQKKYIVADDSKLPSYCLAIGMKLALMRHPDANSRGRVDVLETLIEMLLKYREKYKLRGELEEIVSVLYDCEQSLKDGLDDTEINRLIKDNHKA